MSRKKTRKITQLQSYRAKTLSEPERLLRDFAERQALRLTERLRHEERAIYWSSKARLLYIAGIAALDEQVLAREMSVGLLLNMLERVFENVEASLVTFLAGLGTSSEVLSRAVMEGAINLLYILDAHKELRLLAFFYSYLTNVDKQVRNWLQAVAREQAPGQAHHLAAANRRSNANASLRSIVCKLIEEVGLTEAEVAKVPWPAIADRFKALNLEVNYRTIYARLCAETHSDPEETLRYFVGKVFGDARLLERMAIETVAFSRFMLYYALSYFLRAAYRYAQVFGMEQATAELPKGLQQIEEEMVSTIPLIGAD